MTSKTERVRLLERALDRVIYEVLSSIQDGDINLNDFAPHARTRVHALLISTTKPQEVPHAV